MNGASRRAALPLAVLTAAAVFLSGCAKAQATGAEATEAETEAESSPVRDTSPESNRQSDAESAAGQNDAGGAQSEADGESVQKQADAGGAQNKADGDSEQRYQALRDKRITFLTSQSKYCDEYQQMADYILQKYGCDVTFQIIPDDEYTSFVRLKLMSAEVPDVFEYNTPLQNDDLAAAEYCEDLSGEPWAARLADREAAQDPETGRIYAMPRELPTDVIAVFYNVSVLEACGVTEPDPETYQDFLNLLDRVKRKGKGAVPFYEANGDAWSAQLFMLSGFPASLGDKADETFAQLLDGTLKWTQVPEFEKVLTAYQELIRYGYVNSNHLSAQYADMVEAVGSGAAAMAVMTSRAASMTSARYPDCELGAFVLPYLNRKELAVTRSVQGLFVPREGSQTETAKLFLDLWSRPEVQEIFFSSQRGESAFADVKSAGDLPCVQALRGEYIGTGRTCAQMNERMTKYAPVLQELWKNYVRMAA